MISHSTQGKIRFLVASTKKNWDWALNMEWRHAIGTCTVHVVHMRCKIKKNYFL